MDFLREKGFEVEGYDPYYAPERPDGTFDTILCHYVLNVLQKREQTTVLMDVSEYLRPSGSAFYTVRRDLRRTGFRQHYKHGVPTYQTNVHLPFETAVRTEFCEIYRYRPYPKSSTGHDSECKLCDPPSETTLISESAQSFSLVAMSPIARGQALVAPKRHVASYFDLAEREQQACWLLVNRVHSILRREFKPNGFEVNFQAGTTNSKQVGHTHINLTPQYDEAQPSDNSTKQRA